MGLLSSTAPPLLKVRILPMSLWNFFPPVFHGPPHHWTPNLVSFFCVGVFQTPFAALCSVSLIQTGEKKSGAGRRTGVKDNKDNVCVWKINRIFLWTHQFLPSISPSFLRFHTNSMNICDPEGPKSKDDLKCSDIKASSVQTFYLKLIFQTRLSQVAKVAAGNKYNSLDITRLN